MINIARLLACFALLFLFTIADVVAQNGTPNLLLAKKGIDAEDWKSALPHLTRAIEAEEGKGNVIITAGMYSYRCQAYFNLEKFDLALPDCDKSIEVKADSAPVYHLRAAILSRLGKNDRAIADYTFAIQLEPKEGGHYFSRGIAYSRSGSSDLAIADFGKALELDPSDTDALVLRATELRRKGDYDQALFDYQALIRVEPRMVDAHIGLGLSYRHKRDYERALASFNRALEIDPRSKDALLFRGVVYSDLGDVDRAIADYNEAVRLDPNFVSPYAIRGEALVKKGNYSGAVADFTRGLALGASKAALYSRAWANLYANDGKAAAIDAQKFLETSDSRDRSSYAAIVGFLGFQKQKKSAEAEAVLRSFAKQSDKEDWVANVFSYLFGEITEKQLLALAIDNDKQTEARAYIGEMNLLKGDVAGARSHFEWVKANGNKSFSEYHLALAELSRLPRPGQ